MKLRNGRLGAALSLLVHLGAFGVCAATPTAPLAQNAGQSHPPQPIVAGVAASTSYEMTQMATEAVRLGASGRADEAARMFREVEAHNGFSSMHGTFQRVVYFGLATVERRTSPEDALREINKGCNLPQSMAADWLLRLSLSQQLKDQDAIATSLRTLAQRWPSSLDSYSGGNIRNLIAAMKTSNYPRAQIYELERALYASGWTPKSAATGLEQVWVDFAALSLANHQETEALNAARRVKDYTNLISMRADKRFDPLVRESPASFDVMSAMEFQIVRLREMAATDAAQIDPSNQLAFALAGQGKYEAALAVLDPVLARYRSEDRQPATFDDPEDIASTMAIRAAILFSLKRFDEALVQDQRAIVHPYYGGQNGGALMSYAVHLTRLGRGGEALGLLSDLRHADFNQLGAMHLERIRFCGALDQGDAPGAAKAFEYLSAHRPDSESDYGEALLCKGDMDGAAASLIAQLADERSRAASLLGVQIFRLDQPLTPFDIKVYERRSRLRARPDVQAAIAMVGRVNTYELDR